MLFGTYLVRKDVISSEQFLAAVEARQGQRYTIGQLAVRKGMLSMKQVFDILSTQADTQQLFGEIAVEKGFLTDKDVVDLLTIQQSAMKSIARVLIEMGAISPEECGKHLIAFQQEVDHNYKLYQACSDDYAREYAALDDESATQPWTGNPAEGLPA